MIHVIGEALVDLVVDGAGGPPRAHPGGSPANVALGLARLDVPVTLTTRIGTDDHGALVRKHLENDGVRLAEGSIVDGPTSTATAHLDAAGVATYDFEISWDPGPLPVPPPDTECVHTGSLALTLEPGGREVFTAMRRAYESEVTLSYDPNVRPALSPDPEATRAWIEQVASLCQIIKASEEDLAYLYPGRRHDDVARSWVGEHTPLVVVTLGADGVFAATPREAVQVPALTIALVDTVGAGDSFMAGLLDALRRTDLLRHEQLPALARVSAAELTRLVREAALVSAITCSRPGADPPTRAELDAARR
jgi:fructokinase